MFENGNDTIAQKFTKKFESNNFVQKYYCEKPKIPILSFLNTNLIWNKFGNIMSLIDRNFDFIALTETKIDRSYSTIYAYWV